MVKRIAILWAALTALSVFGQQSTLRPVTASAGLGYTLEGGVAGSLNPVDGFVGYYGIDWTAGLNTEYTNAVITIPQSGTVKKFQVFIAVAGTLGSSENVQFFLRLNNTTDFGVINTTFDWKARLTNNVSINQAVTAGDTISIKLVCPTWVTNPTTCRLGYVIYIE